jgi:hypothetical protein
MFLKQLSLDQTMIDHSLNHALSRSSQSRSRVPGWLSFVAGGVASCGLFYFAVSKPAAEEISLMRIQIQSLEKSIAALAGHQGAVDETNHLLSKLGQQQAYAQSARRSLQDIQELHASLLAQSQELDSAMTSVNQLASLKDLVVANSDDITLAAESLVAADSLHQRLIESRPTTVAAVDASQELLTLRDQMVKNSYLNATAAESLDSLLALRDTLDGEGLDTADASERVAELVSLKDAVLAQTADLKDSIETLELTRAMTSQFHQATAIFKDMRGWMMEIVAMQPSLDKVRIALQPLSDLVNLERMRPDQLREVARWLTQPSTARMASLPSPAVSTSVSELGRPAQDVE